MAFVTVSLRSPILFDQTEKGEPVKRDSDTMKVDYTSIEAVDPIADLVRRVAEV
jgi:hypothetical protein